MKPARVAVCELVVHRIAANNAAFRGYVRGRERSVAEDLARVVRVVVNNSRDMQTWWGMLADVGARLRAAGVTHDMRARFTEEMLNALRDAGGADHADVQAWERLISAAWGGLLKGLIGREAIPMAA